MTFFIGQPSKTALALSSLISRLPKKTLRRAEHEVAATRNTAFANREASAA
jgi:hypothetical protein